MITFSTQGTFYINKLNKNNKKYDIDKKNYGINVQQIDSFGTISEVNLL